MPFNENLGESVRQDTQSGIMLSIDAWEFVIMIKLAVIFIAVVFAVGFGCQLLDLPEWVAIVVGIVAVAGTAKALVYFSLDSRIRRQAAQHGWRFSRYGKWDFKRGGEREYYQPHFKYMGVDCYVDENEPEKIKLKTNDGIRVFSSWAEACEYAETKTK